MLDLYVVLCDHKECKRFALFFRYEEDALEARDGHMAAYSYEDSGHDPYLVTLVARKYAR